ncbi:MAG: lytic murein transglycosylase, partial [Enterovirga sp.]|nr:lytic murein transglycosylase [Enterovirga sp.]
MRIGAAALAALGLLVTTAAPGSAQTAPRMPSAASGQADGFRPFLDGLWPDARAAGISRQTFDGALRGLTPDPSVTALTRKQGEFGRAISAYVTGAVSAARITQGQALAMRWRAEFDRVEASYGVPRGIILAIWASESGYGAATGGFDTIRSLATLAFAGERRDFFRRELIAALQILEQDHLGRDEIKGSWA